jgi:hypothetical protein
MLVAARVTIRYKKDGSVTRKIEPLSKEDSTKLINGLIEWFGRDFMEWVNQKKGARIQHENYPPAG